VCVAAAVASALWAFRCSGCFRPSRAADRVAWWWAGCVSRCSTGRWAPTSRSCSGPLPLLGRVVRLQRGGHHRGGISPLVATELLARTGSTPRSRGTWWACGTLPGLPAVPGGDQGPRLQRRVGRAPAGRLTAQRAPRAGSPGMGAAGQRGQPEPAPVDPVVRDQPVRISITSTMSCWSPSGVWRGYSQISRAVGQVSGTEPARFGDWLAKTTSTKLRSWSARAPTPRLGAEQVANQRLSRVASGR